MAARTASSASTEQWILWAGRPSSASTTAWLVSFSGLFHRLALDQLAAMELVAVALSAYIMRICLLNVKRLSRRKQAGRKIVNA